MSHGYNQSLVKKMSFRNEYIEQLKVATSIPDFETTEGYPIDIRKLYELRETYKKTSKRKFLEIN